MVLNFIFVMNSVLLGVGLAMDAFSVSLANGLNEPKMSMTRMCAIAGTFGFFQAFMPILGWGFVHTVVNGFESLQKFVPWIALILLSYIGGKMLYDGMKDTSADETPPRMTFPGLMVQGVATSIDALSVGFTISEYNWFSALVASLIIAFVTFIICMAGLFAGKKFGMRLAGKATILGGCILLFIGIEIFVRSFL